MRPLRKVVFICGLLAAAFAGGACSQWILGGSVAQAAKGGLPREVRAQAFLVVDAKGRVVARLGDSPDGPTLLLKDDRGNDVVGLGFWPRGAGLTVHPKPGKALFNLGVSLDGRYAGLQVFDHAGRRSVMLGSSPSE